MRLTEGLRCLQWRPRPASYPLRRGSAPRVLHITGSSHNRGGALRRSSSHGRISGCQPFRPKSEAVAYGRRGIRTRGEAVVNRFAPRAFISNANIDAVATEFWCCANWPRRDGSRRLPAAVPSQHSAGHTHRQESQYHLSLLDSALLFQPLVPRERLGVSLSAFRVPPSIFEASAPRHILRPSGPVWRYLCDNTASPRPLFRL